MAMDTFELLDPNGAPLPGYLVTAGGPAVVVVHEVLGLNEQIRGVARRLAGEGLTAFAIDLFRGRTTLDLASGFKMAQALPWNGAIAEIRLAREALSELGGGAKVGIVGFSFGAGVALAAAALIPELVACVPYYGIPTPGRADLTRISGKVQGHFGTNDKQISKSRVDELEELLAGAGVTAEIHRYYAEHGFMNEVRKATFSSYNSQHAWHRMMAFLRRELDAPPPAMATRGDLR